MGVQGVHLRLPSPFPPATKPAANQKHSPDGKIVAGGRRGQRAPIDINVLMGRLRVCTFTAL